MDAEVVFAEEDGRVEPVVGNYVDFKHNTLGWVTCQVIGITNGKSRSFTISLPSSGQHKAVRKVNFMSNLWRNLSRRHSVDIKGDDVQSRSGERSPNRLGEGWQLEGEDSEHPGTSAAGTSAGAGGSKGEGDGEDSEHPGTSAAGTSAASSTGAGAAEGMQVESSKLWKPRGQSTTGSRLSSAPPALPELYPRFFLTRSLSGVEKSCLLLRGAKEHQPDVPDEELKPLAEDDKFKQNSSLKSFWKMLHRDPVKVPADEFYFVRVEGPTGEQTCTGLVLLQRSALPTPRTPYHQFDIKGFCSTGAGQGTMLMFKLLSVLEAQDDATHVHVRLQKCTASNANWYLKMGFQHMSKVCGASMRHVHVHVACVPCVPSPPPPPTLPAIIPPTHYAHHLHHPHPHKPMMIDGT